MHAVVIGPGIPVLVYVHGQLTTGDEINLGDDRLLRRGRFRLTRKGEWKNGSGKSLKIFPYFTCFRVGGHTRRRGGRSVPRHPRLLVTSHSQEPRTRCGCEVFV